MKLISIVAACLLAAFVLFAAGLYSGISRNAAYDLARTFRDTLKTLSSDEGRQEAVLGDAFQHVQPALRPGEGVTVNETGDDGAMIMLSGFFDNENQIRLIRRDGSIVRKWPLSIGAHLPESDKPDLRVDLHGALITPAGEPVFNYEYNGTVKLDRCGEVLWTFNHRTHHSIEPSEAGGYWVPGRRSWPSSSDPDRFPPFSRVDGKARIVEDLILRLDEDGNVVEEVSVPQILYDSGLETLVTAYGHYSAGGHSINNVRGEIVHVNKIGELPIAFADAFPMFEAGDLVLSMRGLNLIVVIDPETWRVRWHQTGPWKRQHDPEFQENGRIGIFNNNLYNRRYAITRHVRPDTPAETNIIEVDPATGATEIVYGSTEGQELLSVIRGKHQPLPDGGNLITEFDGGRILQVDADGAVTWEFINRYNDDFVGEITEARLYPKEYFNVDSWECS